MAYKSIQSRQQERKQQNRSDWREQRERELRERAERLALVKPTEAEMARLLDATPRELTERLLSMVSVIRDEALSSLTPDFRASLAAVTQIAELVHRYHETAAKPAEQPLAWLTAPTEAEYAALPPGPSSGPPVDEEDAPDSSGGPPQADPSGVGVVPAATRPLTPAEDMVPEGLSHPGSIAAEVVRLAQAAATCPACGAPALQLGRVIDGVQYLDCASCTRKEVAEAP